MKRLLNLFVAFAFACAFAAPVTMHNAFAADDAATAPGTAMDNAMKDDSAKTDTTKKHHTHKHKAAHHSKTSEDAKTNSDKKATHHHKKKPADAPAAGTEAPAAPATGTGQ